MQQRRLGRTGLHISELALGTVELGLDYGIPDGRHTRPDEASAARLLNTALDRGINFIDTARAYGESEGVIGRALAHRRSEYVLVTKANLPRTGSIAPANVRNLMRASIATSLRELHTDHVDVLMFHSAPWDWHLRDEVLAAFAEARAAGQARFIGASVYGAAGALDALREGDWDCLQIACNALDREMEADVLPLARQLDVGIIARSVLLKGVLSARAAHLPQPLAPLKHAAEALATLAGVSVHALPALAYRYVLGLAGVSAVLIGTAHQEELAACIGYVQQTPLTPELMAAMRDIVVTQPALLNPSNWPAM